MEAGEFICPDCARFCHSGHSVQFVGTFLSVCSCGHGSEHYHCFLQHPLPGMELIPLTKNRQCTFLQTGREFVSQDIVLCNTCGFQSGDCMCVPCSYFCHRHHDVSEPSRTSSAYCDCGDGNSRFPQCLLVPHDVPPPIHLCYQTYSEFIDRCSLKQPDFKHCVTCDVDICSVCAEHCHKGHELINSSHKICDCATSSVQCPLMTTIEPAA